MIEINKNGIVRNQQRYKCKECGLNFIIGDKRVKPLTAVKRAFAVILYSLGKASYGFIGKLFGVTSAAVLRWIIKALDRTSRRTIAWVIGNCDAATFQRLYDKVKHLTNCTFYTDAWAVFAKIRSSRRKTKKVT